MVKIHNLNFCYGNKQVLENMTFNVDKGTLCGLLGPNGSGKSTFFKCCLNFLKNYGGSIEIDGNNAAKFSPSKAAKIIAYVPQEHKPPFPFTIRELVLMGRTPHMGGIFGLSKNDADIANQAMAIVGIDDLAETPCTQVSGGQRQLAFIARALAQETPLILLDEPTSALDFSNQLKIWQVLRKITSQGVTVIACSHDPNHILWFADTITAMKDGRILAYGKTDVILDNTLLNLLFNGAYKIGAVDNKKIIYPE